MGLFGECKLLPIYLDMFGMVQNRQRETSVSEAFCGKEIKTGMGMGESRVEVQGKK